MCVCVCVCVCLTPLAVRTLVVLGFSVVTVRDGGGLGGGAGATAVFLLDRRRVSDGTLVAAFVYNGHRWTMLVTDPPIEYARDSQTFSCQGPPLHTNWYVF